MELKTIILMMLIYSTTTRMFSHNIVKRIYGMVCCSAYFVIGSCYSFIFHVDNTNVDVCLNSASSCCDVIPFSGLALSIVFGNFQ